MMEDNGAHFFEGTEKLLEVWFSRQDETKGTGDLRTIPRCVSFRCLPCRLMEMLAETPGTCLASFPHLIHDVKSIQCGQCLISRVSVFFAVAIEVYVG